MLQEESYILESKKRCKDLGMDPNKLNIPQNIMSESELAQKKEAYKEILDVVSFFGRKIIKSFEGTPILIGISDEKGYIIDIFGDETIRETVTRLGIRPGAQYIEEHVGTNVVSLTLRQNHPVQLIGTNHYNKSFYNTACYGVPFHYKDDDNLLGTICIMTGVILHNPYFLITLSTVVDAIERELLLRKQSRRINKQQELLYESEKRQRELLEQDLLMKDEFLTLITHEFKTPINVIYSAIQLIEHLHANKVPENVMSLIGNIKQNVFRQLRLVNNLLDITRLNSENFKLNYKNVDIVMLTRLITESINIYASQKNINIYFKSDVSSKNILIDDESYERIILNLLSNAIKFTSDGGSITVTIKENTNHKTVSISVCDTGIGIPQEKHEKIFQRFGQVESNLSRPAEGSGIGLVIVKMLVDILEGSIQLNSEPGVGSTFTITLPIKEDMYEQDNKGFLDSDSRLIKAVNVEFSDIYF